MNQHEESTEREELLKIASARLNPAWTNPNFLVLRARKIIFEKWIHEFPQKKLQILDVGGRYQPYRPLFEERISQYIAVDILQTELVDVVGSGDALPFAANTFDVAIVTQVLEYFANPGDAGAHIYSALKPGGKLLASVASFAPRFVDEECWRFTPRGIRESLSLFKKVEIVPETLSLGGLVRTLNLAMHTYAHFQAVRKIHEWTFCPLLNGLGLWLERLKLTNNDQFTPNYSVLAEK